MKNKPKLIVNFSAGETSAYMALKLKELYEDKYEILNIFANTGREDPRSLDFAHKVDNKFRLNLVWVEAVINGPREGTTHRIVTYENADRVGYTYEAAIQKFGIPNMSYNWCTRALKLKPIEHYCKVNGWKDGALAMGIRVDEIDRVSSRAAERNLVYPLVNWIPTTKEDVNEFWGKQPFRLEIESWEGNCQCCWKKSARKLCTIAKLHPERFDWMREMQSRYENFVPAGQDAEKRPLPIRFLRKNRSVDDIFKMAQEPFELAKDDKLRKRVQFSIFDFLEKEDPPTDPLDEGSGCEESCELYADD